MALNTKTGAMASNKGRPKKSTNKLFKAVYFTEETFEEWRSARSDFGFYTDSDFAQELLTAYDKTRIVR